MDTGPPRSPKVLHHLNVLVVEDDYLQATTCALALQESGANVLGPLSDVADAREFLEMVSPDCVLLDLRLRDEYAFLFATELRERRIPVVLATGYDISVFPFSPEPSDRLSKPFSDRQLIEAVRTAVGRRTTGMPAANSDMGVF